MRFSIRGIRGLELSSGSFNEIAVLWTGKGKGLNACSLGRE